MMMVMKVQYAMENFLWISDEKSICERVCTFCRLIRSFALKNYDVFKMELIQQYLYIYIYVWYMKCKSGLLCTNSNVCYFA